LSDPRAPADKAQPASGLVRKADAALRSVRLSGLPDLKAEQEPLLQQALEKLVDKVVCLSVINETHEAVAELETPASASKLVLMKNMHFQSCTVVFSEEITQPPKRATKHVTVKAPVSKAKLALSTTEASAPSSSVSFVPRAAKVTRGPPRPGLGYAQGASLGAGVNVSGDVETEPANVASSNPGDQDVFRKMLGGS